MPIPTVYSVHQYHTSIRASKSITSSSFANVSHGVLHLDIAWLSPNESRRTNLATNAVIHHDDHTNSIVHNRVL
jgi:hypothetical protein